MWAQAHVGSTPTVGTRKNKSIYMDQENENKKEIDLSKAPNDSGVKSNEWQSQTSSYLPGTPKIIQWIIKYSGGLVRDEKQASYVLIGFVALAIAVVIIFMVSGGSNQPTPGTIPADQFVP